MRAKKGEHTGLIKMHILSDALKVIRAINGLVDWSIYPIFPDIRELSSTFENISFSHVSKSFNDFARGLTKKSYGLGNFPFREGGMAS